jgi:hypothetical protein
MWPRRACGHPRVGALVTRAGNLARGIAGRAPARGGSRPGDSSTLRLRALRSRAPAYSRPIQGLLGTNVGVAGASYSIMGG